MRRLLAGLSDTEIKLSDEMAGEAQRRIAI
jgi:hypothetical protein